jgi:hypothetical protein
MRKHAIIVSLRHRVIMVVVLVMLLSVCVALVQSLRASLSVSFIGYTTGYRYGTNYDGVIPGRGALFLLRNTTKHHYKGNLQHTVVHPSNGSIAITQQCVLYNFWLEPNQRIKLWAPEPETPGHWHCAFELVRMPVLEGWQTNAYSLATRYPVLMPVYDKLVGAPLRKRVCKTVNSPEIYR